MTNTNNRLEGIFTDLKRNTNNHSSMCRKSRERFINGYILALSNKPAIKKDGSASPRLLRLATRPYTCHGRSPAEPCYTSGCTAKTATLIRYAMLGAKIHPAK
jgi:hypothetical protein